MGFRSLKILFKVGDRVHAYSGGELYDGIGRVTEVSVDLEHGTPVLSASWPRGLPQPRGPQLAARRHGFRHRNAYAECQVAVDDGFFAS